MASNKSSEMIERCFLDHLGQILGSPKDSGKLDLAAMSMYLPTRWWKEPLGILIRAHELIHLRLTYMTGFGIFLDMIGGISSVKILNLLRTTPTGDVLFPLERNFRSKEIEDTVLSQVAFSIICEIGIDMGLRVWRYLQEGMATYAMLEMAPERILSEGLYGKSVVERAKTEILNNLYGIYYDSYKELLSSSNTLGKEQIFQAALLASDIPLYSINLFTSPEGDPLEASGKEFGREIERFCKYISSESASPTRRFRKLLQNISDHDKGDRDFDLENLNSFNPFAVPDLFPNEDWRERIDRWISVLPEVFGTGEKVLPNLYHQIVDEGLTPTLFYQDNEEELSVGFLRGLEETAVLRYVLSSLKRYCLRKTSTTIQLPSNWSQMSVKEWIQDTMDVIRKHELPIELTIVEF